MTEKSPARTASTTVDLACFELAGQTWAVPIANVREILATPRLTPLPDAPSVIEGVIELRGTWIPVVDLESLIIREGTPAGPRSRTVVVETRELVIGFRVDRATQVVATTTDAMERLPELAREVGCLVVGAVVRREDRSPILVLDLEVLLDRVVRSGSSASANDEVAA
jgi:purine-binding chemotaxis protein CheW